MVYHNENLTVKENDGLVTYISNDFETNTLIT
jgi:hypothetical protein